MQAAYRNCNHRLWLDISDISEVDKNKSQNCSLDNSVYHMRQLDKKETIADKNIQ